jgi:hypothetical protein
MQNWGVLDLKQLLSTALSMQDCSTAGYAAANSNLEPRRACVARGGRRLCLQLVKTNLMETNLMTQPSL